MAQINEHAINKCFFKITQRGTLKLRVLTAAAILIHVCIRYKIEDQVRFVETLTRNSSQWEPSVQGCIYNAPLMTPSGQFLSLNLMGIVKLSTANYVFKLYNCFFNSSYVMSNVSQNDYFIDQLKVLLVKYK